MARETDTNLQSTGSQSSRKKTVSEADAALESKTPRYLERINIERLLGLTKMQVLVTFNFRKSILSFVIKTERKLELPKEELDCGVQKGFLGRLSLS